MSKFIGDFWIDWVQFGGEHSRAQTFAHDGRVGGGGRGNLIQFHEILFQSRERITHR